MKTVLDTIQAGAGYLEKKGIENGRLNMQHLVAHVLECDRMQLYVEFDRPLGEEELAPLRDLLKRRSEGEPLQHLLGRVEFAGSEFRCDERALIPRPETEELVDRLIDRYSGIEPPGTVLDMGAGSGVIGLSLAKAWSTDVQGVVLADISVEALGLARENAEKIGSPLDKLTFVESDLFSGLEGKRFDLIVANLPYVANEELRELSREVQHDPRGALDGGVKGMEVMMRFVERVQQFSNDGCCVAMEFGMGQGSELLSAMKEFGWQEVELVRDFSDVERFLFAAN